MRYKYHTYDNEVEICVGEVFFNKGIFYFGKKDLFAMNDGNFSEESLDVVGVIFEIPELK